MKLNCRVLLLAILAWIVPTTMVRAAAGGPEFILYRFPSVKDSGGAAETGVATSFHCTNFSGVTETIRIVVRTAGGGVAANFASDTPHLNTRTFSTHQTAIFVDGAGDLATNTVSQGTAAIAATSLDIICTAMIVDAASASPVGFALRGVRFNPIPGSQE